MKLSTIFRDFAKTQRLKRYTRQTAPCAVTSTTATSSSRTTSTAPYPPEYPRPDKISYLSVPGRSPLLGLTIGELIDSTAEKFPHHDGLVVSDIGLKRTFKELQVEIDNLAAGLLKLGLTRGSRVGIWGPNSHQYYLTQMAAWKAGLILVTINSAFKPNELLYCITNVGVSCLVLAENLKTQNYYEMVCKVVPEIPNSKPGQLESSAAPELRTVLTMGSSPLPGTLTVQDVLESGNDPTVKKVLAHMQSSTEFDDVCNIQFTSGTTGYPKGAMLTHHNIVNNSYFTGKRFLFTDKDRICLPVPLFHCFGCITGTLLALHFGSACVLPTERTFNPLASITAASKERCTAMYGTPTMHIAMLNIPEFDSFDLSSLRIACTGGASCPEDLIKTMKRKYTVNSVGSLYGMTETSPVFYQSLPEDTDVQRASTVGYPMEHCEVKVVDPDGHVVPIGTPGEMCTRGYMTMRGYWNDPIKTDQILKPSNWLHTGDLMVMHETGHATVVGRLKDTIIRGGENIFPIEIEEYLHSHPNIVEAHAFGVPDYRMGEEVAVWIRLAEKDSLTNEEVKAYCKDKIAHYKIPKFIHFVDDFPKTASGKIQKFRMREEMVNRINHRG